MESIRRIVVTGVAGAALVAAAMFAGPGEGGQILPHVASVAAANKEAAKCSSKEIYIALPILSGSDRCISNDPSKGGAIVVYLKMVLKLLSGAVGLVIILMLVIAGIQYITSTGDPGAIKKAKDRITNAITALVLFLMAYAILNFLIPGGIL